MLAALILSVAQAPVVRIERPPAHPFVLRGSVPLSGPLRSADGYPSQWSRVADGVVEVAALVPAGTTELRLEPGSPSGPTLTDAALAWTLGRITLRVDGVAYSLSDAAHFTGWYRRGRVLSTATMHRDLGAHGAAEWWITAAADGGLHLALLWHRGTPGPDVRFSAASLEVRGGSWTPVVAPPACTPPYLAAHTPSGARHVLPQQMGMAWWLEIRPAGRSSRPEVVGVGDWSAGGYLPSGFPIDPRTPREPYAGRLAEARGRLAALLPDPPWGGAPASPLWPASGARFGGEGGGHGRLPLDGVQWAASAGDADALAYYRIGLLRGLARARIRLGADGLPLALDGLPRSWSFDTAFLGGRDAPWEWDRWGVSWAGPADPRNFADHDTASMVRRLRHAWVLAWLAHDPVARLLALEGATRAELTFGPLALPAQPGRGTEAGMREAQAALAIAAARELEGRGYDQWRDAYVAHMRAAQMPSGCFTARLGGYPSGNRPFADYPGIMLSGGAEMAHTMLALASFGEMDAVRLAARGMVNLGTDDDDPGWYYFFPTGLGGALYEHEDDWPAALHDAMGLTGSSGYYTAWDVGYAIALVAGTPEFPELLRRFGDPLSWGPVAPSAQTSAPVEQWWPLLGALP